MRSYHIYRDKVCGTCGLFGRFRLLIPVVLADNGRQRVNYGETRDWGRPIVGANYQERFEGISFRSIPKDFEQSAFNSSASPIGNLKFRI